jgi:hypothetical protein
VVLVERLARARFRVIRINRWSLVVVLAMLLTLLLLPGKYRQAAGDGGGQTIRPGVTLANRDFSGVTEAQARAMLRQMAPTFAQQPVDARVGQLPSGISYVIPELNGYALDEEKTWQALASAGAHTRVEPVARVYTPSKKLTDYPQSVIRQGNPNKQGIGLLINVDWGTDELQQMLAIFQKRGVKVTFFVSGRWAEQNQALLKQMAAQGHEIATHGHNLEHGPFELARQGKLQADIARSVAQIQQVTSTPVRYYAPHRSEVNEAVIKAAGDLQLRTVLYSLDTVDWRDPAPAVLAVLSKAMPGDLILMHPKPATVQVLETALARFQSQGLTPMTLSQLLSPEPSSAVRN